MAAGEPALVRVLQHRCRTVLHKHSWYSACQGLLLKWHAPDITSILWRPGRATACQPLASPLI